MAVMAKRIDNIPPDGWVTDVRARLGISDDATWADILTEAGQTKRLAEAWAHEFVTRQQQDPDGWRPIATAPKGYDGETWTYVLFKGYSKGKSFPGEVVVSGWMGTTHDGKLAPVYDYAYKLVITRWRPMLPGVRTR